MAEPDAYPRTLRGVREDVLQQDVHARREVAPRYLDERLIRGHVNAHRAILVLGERAPERGALRDDANGVARNALSVAALPPGLPDYLADRTLHGVDVVQEPRVT